APSNHQQDRCTPSVGCRVWRSTDLVGAKIAPVTDTPTPGLEELRFYDTRTREVRTFEPCRPGRAGIYTCGPTVYAPQTLGNMRSQVFPDLLRRVLMAAGYEVTYVTNITDVGHLVSDADEAAARLGPPPPRPAPPPPTTPPPTPSHGRKTRRRPAASRPTCRPAPPTTT